MQRLFRTDKAERQSFPYMKPLHHFLKEQVQAQSILHLSSLISKSPKWRLLSFVGDLACG